MPEFLPRGLQNPFLASPEVLDCLIAHLSVVDVFRLGLCCKGLRSWVLQTPVDLWKVSLLARKPGQVLC